MNLSRAKAKTAACAALLATGVLALSGCSATGSEDTIRIGIKYDQPGLGYQDGRDYTGFDTDVARYVAAELGYSEDQIEWVEAPSANRENMLTNNQVDMIFATYSITEKRLKTVDFAGPYFVAGQDLLVQAENTDITGPESLAGKNLCSVTGSTSAKKIQDKYSSEVQLVQQNSYSDCVVALNAGMVDAVTTDDIILAGLASTKANQGELKLVGNTFSTENYGVGLSKGSDKCAAINAAINKMVETGAWEEAIKKNVGAANYTYNAELNPPVLTDACVTVDAK
ncbi:glutamate ABC transporter substrate-binding protein [Rothia nasimurium]|uniref:Glutamate ABC transporter substrate-binding protein n=1 Tax=Rothia nasimurium TaxID=85336 RepID=A0A4Y9F0Z3_9MICC|nr:glutamate ABC transporter substrate-binding protein [Rothia nasimurium]MBF0809075.1 glutamate ABC transporter substrate-binding protein [Rothia nasimurium]TFU20724.1 glutamate ABC transporter substrate-binding protein [Rothia nasimurium]